MYHTDIFTYFTKPTGESEVLYSAETWVMITLVLETAGPVSISTRQDVVPVLSGKGVLLEPDGEPLKFVLPKGDRLIIAAEAINRVKVIIEPFPWLEQILMALSQGFGGLKKLLSRRRPTSENKPEITCPPLPNIRR